MESAFAEKVIMVQAVNIKTVRINVISTENATRENVIATLDSPQIIVA